MQQQINLYQPIDSAKEEPFSATMMLTILGLTLILMVIFYGILFGKKASLEAEVNELKVQNEQTRIVVEKLEATVNKLTDAKKEQQQLSYLKKIYDSKQHALDELSTMAKGNNAGVSDYFLALARKNIEPVWFSDINIYSGGQQIILKGQTTDARSIPQFIASLKEETVFSGVNFRLFNARRNDTGTILDFVLQTELQTEMSQSR